MAKCPKCDYKLKLTDISQFCPSCGVNMRFYNFEENFIREAKIAELSQATVSVKIKRLKAALIGSKLTIVRLVVSLLPLLALAGCSFLPGGAATFTMSILGLKDVEISLGAMGLYTMFTNGDFGFMGTMCGSGEYGSMFSSMQLAVFSYAAIAVFALFTLLLSVLCFLSIKKMQKVIIGWSALGIVSCIANIVLTGIAVKSFNDYGGVLGAASGYSVYIIIVMFAVVIAINAILDKKGISVEYAEGSLERLEIWHKVKAGEVNVDDLPQPVVETAETRKIDEEIAKEEESFRKKQEEEQEGGDEE